MNKKKNTQYENILSYIERDSLVINYILHDQDSKTNKIFHPTISPLIIPPHFCDFFTEIKKDQIPFIAQGKVHIVFDSVFDSLYILERSLHYEPYIDIKIGNLIDCSDTNSIVFVSEQYDNFLTASIFAKTKNTTITEIPLFGVSVSFLFVFSGDSVLKVYSRLNSNN